MKADDNHEPDKNNNDHVLSEEQIKILVKRKVDFLAGKTTSRPWNEIKQRYEEK